MKHICIIVPYLILYVLLVRRQPENMGEEKEAMTCGKTKGPQLDSTGDAMVVTIKGAPQKDVCQHWTVKQHQCSVTELFNGKLHFEESPDKSLRPLDKWQNISLSMCCLKLTTVFKKESIKYLTITQNKHSTNVSLPFLLVECSSSTGQKHLFGTVFGLKIFTNISGRR